MTTIRYKFSYDDEFDKDIDNWINSIPRSKKSEMIIRAIRFYMSNGEDATVLPVAQPVHVTETIIVKEADTETGKRVRPKVFINTDKKIEPLNIEGLMGTKQDEG